MKLNEETIIRVADKYKRVFCNLIKNGREANLTQLLKDESKLSSASMNVLDYARENLNSDQRFIIHIHFCLSLLSPEEREIIWKEFFISSPKLNKLEWWYYKYARSTYYRIRSRAIRKFSELCS